MTILFKHQKKYIKTKSRASAYTGAGGARQTWFHKNINLMSCKIKYSRIVFKGVIKDFKANLLKRRAKVQKLFIYLILIINFL
jgi:hypothetical protein